MTPLRPVRTIAPAAALITLAEAKAQCRVDHADDDTLIDGLISAVMALLDGPNGWCSRALVNQSWKDAWSGFPDGAWMPVGVESASAITSIRYYGPEASTQTTLDAATYWLLPTTLGERVALAGGASWPATAERPDAVEVTYVAGFGATAASVPANIRHAGLLMLSHLYENRDAVIVGQSVVPAELPMGVKALLGPWVRPQG